MERADQEPASARGQGAAGARAAWQTHRGERDPAGHGARFRRVADLALHHHAGGGRAAVAGDPGFPFAVLPQHGDRTLHPGDRRDGRDGLQPLLETLGDSIRARRDLAERFPRMGGERSHVADLPLRPQRHYRSLDRHDTTPLYLSASLLPSLQSSTTPSRGSRWCSSSSSLPFCCWR